MDALHLILQPNAHGWAVGLTDGRELSLPRTWFEVVCAALPASATKALKPLLSPGRETSGSWVGPLAGQRPDVVRLGAGSGVTGPALSNRPRVPRRLAVALLLLGFVLPLLAPGRSLASRLIVRREADARGLSRNHPRHDKVPTQLAAAAPSRPGVGSTADDASVLVLGVLALNSAVMLIRVASSPPSWMKD
jgi:hypothetical protein